VSPSEGEIARLSVVFLSLRGGGGLMSLLNDAMVPGGLHRHSQT